MRNEGLRLVNNDREVTLVYICTLKNVVTKITFPQCENRFHTWIFPNLIRSIIF